MTDTVTLIRPDDWHIHFRDGAAMHSVIADTARVFGRAIVMPNLVPPITTTAMAAAYRDRIRAAVDPALRFEPLMTAYLTDTIDPDELARGHAEGVFTAAKLYPAGATTHSAIRSRAAPKAYPASSASTCSISPHTTTSAMTW